MIYDIILTSESKPPQTPAEAHALEGRWRGLDLGPARGKPRCLRQMKLPQVACFGLLGCNRQVSGEMSELIAARKARGLITYKLDLMVDCHLLYPTWISLPTAPRSVSRVEVNLRISHHQAWTTVTSSLRRIEGLKRLLSAFVFHGPQFTHDRRLRSLMKLDHLVINFFSFDPTGIDPSPMNGVNNGGPCTTYEEVADWLYGLLNRYGVEGTLFPVVDVLSFRSNSGKMHDGNSTWRSCDARSNGNGTPSSLDCDFYGCYISGNFRRNLDRIHGSPPCECYPGCGRVAPWRQNAWWRARQGR